MNNNLINELNDEIMKKLTTTKCVIYVENNEIKNVEIIKEGK